MVICLERGADLHMVQLMPLSLASVNSTLVFTFLVPDHPGGPGQRAVKRVCVCVCALAHICSIHISVYLMFRVCYKLIPSVLRHV